MRRMGRMAGIELAAGDTVERLWRLHRELVNTGQAEWAAQIARILKINALKTAAEYVRRNSAYFVQNGPTSLDAKAVQERRAAISDVADNIDALAQSVTEGEGDYSEFDEILDDLRALGFWIDGTLVSAVARAFTLP
jgi:hypothetical protein